MSLTASIKSALSGIRTSQTALGVVSDNVNNVSTEGYSRKAYSQHTVVLADGRSTGAVSNVNFRQVDMQLRNQYRTESGIMQSSYVRSYYLSLIQNKMGTPDAEKSISNRITAMQTAFETLGVDTDKLNSKSTAVASIDVAVSQFSSLTAEIQSVRKEADQAISELCEEVTDILNQLDKLNDDIVRCDVTGKSSDNFRDQRDTMITRLSEIMDIQTYERANGETVILTAGGKALLDKDATTVSHVPAAATGSLVSYSAGSITGIYAGEYEITNEIGSGEIAGLIHLRDKEVQDLQLQLDELAYQMTTAMNFAASKATNYPNMTYEMTGSRTFIDETMQSVAISGGDVKIVLFDEDGHEAFAASMTADLGFTAGTIDTLTDKIQTWLRSPAGADLSNAVCEIDKDGHMHIDLADSRYSIAFREETEFLEGADETTVTINFDADGDGAYDKDIKGFSSFFGLNDFIVVPHEESVYDSQIMSASAIMGIKGTTTLHFSNVDYGLDFGAVQISATDNIRTIAEKINATMVDSTGEPIVKAEVLREGAGYRLRISDANDRQLEITETYSVLSDGVTLSGSVLKRLGLERSHAGFAQGLTVRADVLARPALLATGKVQYSQESGEYYLSDSDNSVANDYCAVFTEPVKFSAAGDFAKTVTKLSDYAASIVSDLATAINDANSKYDYQSGLVETLYSKEQDISGVDLDEELSMMLLYQRTYSAAAKVLSTTFEMLELLDSIV